MGCGMCVCVKFCCNLARVLALHLCASALSKRSALSLYSYEASLPSYVLLPLPLRPTRRQALKGTNGKPVPFPFEGGFLYSYSLLPFYMSACEGREERGGQGL